MRGSVVAAGTASYRYRNKRSKSDDGWKLRDLDDDIVKEKKEESTFKTLNVRNPSQSNIVKKQKEKTSEQNWGYKYPSQSPEIKLKMANTSSANWGVSHPMKSLEVQNKVKQTNLDTYGSEYFYQSNQFKLQRDIVMFERLMKSDRLKDRCTPNFQLSEYTNTHGTYSWICTKCNKTFEDNLRDGKIPRCTHCYPITKHRSFLEIVVSDFCKQYYPKLIENDRIVLKNIRRELDVYIPEINLAIEFNGLLWHSEIFGKKDKDYHKMKTDMCREQGIQLIHIFEDEWISKESIVRSVLKFKMKKITNVVYARNCIIKEVSNEDAFSFLFDNHLQGYINGYHLGLYNDNILVAMMTVGSPRFNKSFDLEIYRFCNALNTTITGGFTKLLRQVEQIKKPNNVISYVDRRYGNGNSYKYAGFDFLHETLPGYFYIGPPDYQRKSRLGFQKHLLKDKLPLFDETLTEWENMQINGYDRIWDCGQLAFGKTINS